MTKLHGTAYCMHCWLWNMFIRSHLTRAKWFAKMKTTPFSYRTIS